MEVLELCSGLMEKTVVVKKLSEAKTQGHREYIAEMETLEKVKHQNLIPLIGYCSFNEENLLVYEYMVNAWGA
jgi:serine/threonine protein kinase